MWTDDVVVWHSATASSDKRAGAAGHRLVHQLTTTDRRYEILDRQFFDGGFVQQHILHANGRNGGSIAMRVCIVIKVGANGLISRIDEYFDPAEMAPLLESKQEVTWQAHRNFSAIRHPSASGTSIRTDPTIGFKSQVDLGPVLRSRARFTEFSGDGQITDTQTVFGRIDIETGIAGHRDRQARRPPALRGLLRSREVPRHQRGRHRRGARSTATPSTCGRN